MAKSAEAFRTISEVADDLGIPKHVLRFWEVKFAQIRPMKRGGGRRYYRPEDLELLKGIQHLLHRDGYTIKGVQKILREQGVEAVKIQAGIAAGAQRESTRSGAGQAAVSVSLETVPAVAGARIAPTTVRTGAPVGSPETMRQGPAGQRAAKDQRPPAPSAAIERASEHVIEVAIAELQACRAVLRGEPVAATVVGRRGRAGSRR